MKTIAPALRTGIDNGTIATFVKITRKDGIIKGFTNHDKPLTVDSLLYVPVPGLERVTMNLRSNAEVSNQEFGGGWVLDLDDSDLSSGIYDDALISVHRADWSNPSAGVLIVFEGSLGIISWTEDGFKADVYSTMKKLDSKIGATTTAQCRHALFDPAGPTRVGLCGLSAATFTYTGSVTGSPTKISFTETGVGQADDWIANGVLTWTSGLNNGTTSEVKSYTTNVIELFLPTTFLVNSGDTFTVTAGCDKKFETCKAKFSNQDNFGGFPHIVVEANWK